MKSSYNQPFFPVLLEVSLLKAPLGCGGHDHVHSRSYRRRDGKYLEVHVKNDLFHFVKVRSRGKTMCGKLAMLNSTREKKCLG